ncbi:hypothetical protein NDU88_003418 [Pleurodeles waltl]|uniref:Uncharacterized protein n=1 Tax=Pleurodeles waltl TaxID=8319 RepID=A0AAV7KXD6_PLEWA|nr:hypothetical protein NDU88_003418 [Pleurodeles waltl]
MHGAPRVQEPRGSTPTDLQEPQTTRVGLSGYCSLFEVQQSSVCLPHRPGQLNKKEGGSRRRTPECCGATRSGPFSQHRRDPSGSRGNSQPPEANPRYLRASASLQWAYAHFSPVAGVYPRSRYPRGLVVPGRLLRGRSRLRLLQDPRALCPQISAPWSSFDRACPPTSEGLLTVCRTSTASPPTAAVTPLHLRRGCGSNTPQPAPYLPVIIQVPLGVRVRSTPPTLFTSLSGGPGPGRSRSGLRVSAFARRPEPGRHFV